MKSENSVIVTLLYVSLYKFVIDGLSGHPHDCNRTKKIHANVDYNKKRIRR